MFKQSYVAYSDFVAGIITSLVVVFFALIATVAAKPGIHSVAYPAAPVVAAAYTAPIAAYTAPVAAAYTAAYTAPVSTAFAAPYAAYTAPVAYSSPLVAAAYQAPVAFLKK